MISSFLDPGSPGPIIVSSITPTSFTAQWVPASVPFDGYTIELIGPGNPTYDNTADSDTNSVDFSTLKPLSDYRVVVRSRLAAANPFPDQYGDQVAEVVESTGESV